jgi:hypothetical protein
MEMAEKCTPRRDFYGIEALDAGLVFLFYMLVKMLLCLSKIMYWSNVSKSQLKCSL